MNAGAINPLVGTDPCGLARGGTVSDGESHGSNFGCVLKSVNQEQPVIATVATTAIRPRPTPDTRRPTKSALTSYLPRPVLHHDRLHRIGILGGRRDPD